MSSTGWEDYRGGPGGGGHQAPPQKRGGDKMKLEKLFEKEDLQGLEKKIEEICEEEAGNNSTCPAAATFEAANELEKEDIRSLADILTSLTSCWYMRDIEELEEDTINPILKEKLLKQGIDRIPVPEENGVKWVEETIEEFKAYLIDVIEEEIAYLFILSDASLDEKFKILKEAFGSSEVYRLHRDGKMGVFNWRTLRIEKIETINRYFLTLETAYEYVALDEIC